MPPITSRPVAQTLAAQLSVSQTSSNPGTGTGTVMETFETTSFPERMGNAANYAYGGCALGAGVQAAYQTVPKGYKPYSISGSFLAPVSTEAKLHCAVRRLRDTKTFATRLVEISQVQPKPQVGKQKEGSGSQRLCMIMLADFQREGEDALLTYSARPDRTYSPPEACLTPQELVSKTVAAGTIPPESEAKYNTLFGLLARLFETRLAGEGIGAQNLTGMAKSSITDQDHLPLPSKTTADWIRSRTPLSRESDQYAGLVFLLDSYLSFLPLVHSKRFIDDAGACASLDFSVRVFSSEWDLTDWNFRELKTVAGGEGRTYSESRLWNREGKLVANMTQQSILRPLKGPKPVL
ncbi:acyl-CoA thioesterase II [Aspergillus pseudoustus]|uniref:Acyl-CoA thioesterase II n=1 Tax=Aspergillus pseudoustus TaxID=1810923 RepID=A0ABR4KW43_9EURO